VATISKPDKGWGNAIPYSPFFFNIVVDMLAILIASEKQDGEVNEGGFSIL
jgi:hypothetical protein